MDIQQSVKDGYARGFSYTPLNGKIPKNKGWNTAPRETLETALKWAEQGNVGIRTGASSGGLVVIDEDDGGSIELPDTLTVKTGSGGFHYYFHYDKPLGNSTSKLSAHVDVRGTNGQIAAAGCTHASGNIYEYINDLDIAPLPAWIPEKLNQDIDWSAEQELAMALSRISATKKGQRNHALNAISFSLRDLISSRKLSLSSVKRSLISASTLPKHEATITVESALSNILIKLPETDVPGVHTTGEVSNYEFVNSVIPLLPNLYRRDVIVVNEDMKPITPDAMRLIMDKHVKLYHNTRKNKKNTRIYKPATRDYASLVLSACESKLPPIDIYTHYPIYLSDWTRCKRGYHNNIYSTSEDIKPSHDIKILHSLVEDFPFKSEADFENFISMLITPLIRNAIQGNIPMFLIKSTRPRTGKTKLVEQVTGGTYLGEEAPAMQWAVGEEQDKRILSILKEGHTLLHIDNISAYIDSPALASLITAKKYSGRILGKSQMVTFTNNLTIMATANNPRATGEIVRRIVPISLQPDTDAPELRDDFKHPDLFAYVLRNRKRVLSSLIGLVEQWLEAGKPATAIKIGGFEGWVKAMSGIMHVAGFKHWMTNWKSWVQNSDPEGEDLRDFVDIWWSKYQRRQMKVMDLVALAEEHDLFTSIFSYAHTEQAKNVRFAQQVLIKYMDAVIGDKTIRKGAHRVYVLEEV